MMKSSAGRATTTSKPFFTCPSCDALYHIVKVEVGLEFSVRGIACRTCGLPLHAREGKFIFKYFLLRNPHRGQKSKRTHGLPAK
jgi:transcription elongation factor Elf1